MELISIIVPVYNAERYLGKCIQSVLKQTYTMWELVLIDDGSTDNSYKICKLYSEKDNRIKCVHLDNRGRVHARKVGMRNSKGSLITFLDSDDWLEHSALENMYIELNGKSVDCVIAGYIETSDSGEKIIMNEMPKGVYSNNTLSTSFFPLMLCYGDFFEVGIQPFLWNELYRREIIEQSIMESDERIVVGEDVICVFSALLQTKSVLVLDKAFYHYYLHMDSTMRTYRVLEKEVENVKLQYVSLKNIFEASIHADCLMPQLKRYILHHLMVRALPFVIQDKKCGLLKDIPITSSIIIYGAGGFGSAVYQYVLQKNQYKISAWCDRDYIKYQNMKYPVISVEAALQQDFDYIFVSVMSKKTVDKIKESLLCRGVGQAKIVWMNIEELDQIDLLKLFG